LAWNGYENGRAQRTRRMREKGRRRERKERSMKKKDQNEGDQGLFSIYRGNCGFIHPLPHTSS
jgi:hypothetical protein